jgi:hypothetical protein
MSILGIIGGVVGGPAGYLAGDIVDGMLGGGTVGGGSQAPSDRGRPLDLFAPLPAGQGTAGNDTVHVS